MASESINDFAVKLGVDATGVATGMAAATASILQSQREIAKAEQIEREINIQQKIEAEEKFNKWYATEQEREFQAWFKLEQQKETILQEEATNRERLARETAAAQLQASMNAYNAAISNERRLTTAIEEETQKQLAFSRQLQEAVVARYAAQDAAEALAINAADTDTQAFMDDAWERIVAQQRATLSAFYDEKDRMASESAAHTLRVTEQEQKYQAEADAHRMRSLREDIQARAAAAVEQERLTQEEAEQYIEQQERRVAAAFRAQKRIEEDAARFRAGASGQDMLRGAGGRIPVSERTITAMRTYVAYVEEGNRLETEAIAIRRQLMTAQQLHTERVADYNAMLARNIITQDEHTAAVARSTQIMNTNAGGFGGTGAAITQASYAAEDFIQVLSMGGGMNMALMSASNNLSMVARSVLGANAAMGALAGFGVPAVLIGLGMLIRYLSETEDASEKAKKALELYRKEMGNIGRMTELNQQIAAETRDIQGMRSREEVERKITELKQQQRDLNEQMAQQEAIRQGANAAYFDEMLGGQQAIDAFQKSIHNAIIQGTEEQQVAARELSRLYTEARQAAIAGNEQEMFDALRQLHDAMTSVDGILLDGASAIQDVLTLNVLGLMDSLTDPKLKNELQDIFNPNMMDLEENLERQREIADELISQQEHMTEERKRQLEIANMILQAQEQMIQIEGQAQRQQQDKMRNELELLRMTEAQREARRLRDEALAFAGIDVEFVGPQQPLDEQAAMQEFLLLKLKQLEGDIEQMSPTTRGAVGLEQDAFDAQAKAFEQALATAFQKPDPQVEKTNALLAEIKKELEKGGMLQVIP